jgi:hypothetical protein
MCAAVALDQCVSLGLVIQLSGGKFIFRRDRIIVKGDY